MIATGREIIEPWPEHPDLPDHGVALRRDVLDESLRDRAREAGVIVLMGHEAIAPLVERGFVRGATACRRSTASGRSAPASSWSPTERTAGSGGRSAPPAPTTGRTASRRGATGRARGRPTTGWRRGSAIPDANGNADRRVRLGRAARRRHREHRHRRAVVVPRHPRRATSSSCSTRSPGRSPTRGRSIPSDMLKSPTRFRVPLGGSVGPTMGPTFLVVGDAAGVANPFNGDGVDAALMTGRLAADVLDEALTSGNSTSLQRYPTLLAERSASTTRSAGSPLASSVGPASCARCCASAMRSDRVMGAALRIATGELRDRRSRLRRARLRPRRRPLQTRPQLVAGPCAGSSPGRPRPEV